ncbi:MAG: thiamine pyrophosphate-dependent enzyme [Pseudomonadota bacterium]
MSQTVASLTVEMLIANGIDQLYCLPGVQNDGFFDALYDRQDALTPIHSRHEQGAAYMALGAAMATGKPQAYCVVPGPGFLNTTAALCTAYATNARVLALSGQIPAPAVGKGHGLLHEIPDQQAVMGSLTKFSRGIADADEASSTLRTVFEELKSGCPQPVGMEIPMNLWTASAGEAGDLTVDQLPVPQADAGLIEEAARLLKQAKYPMIIVGSGAQDYAAQVKDLAELLNAPVLVFRAGHGVLSSAHPLSITMPMGHYLWPEVDVVIGLGTRMQSQPMSWGTDDDLKLIHIDIDENRLGRSSKVDVGIHADLANALPSLLAALGDGGSQRQDWRERVSEVKQTYLARFETELAPQMGWIHAIRSELPEDGIFVDELTQVGYVSRFAFPSYQPRTFLSTGYQGTLGWGIATALGAAHARRDVPVVGISGDGGALFTISELATAVRHNIPLTMVIFNDNAFGNVRRIQKDSYNGRTIASDLASPDFVALAESFGVQGLRATTPDELKGHLSRSIKSGVPTVIEVPVGEMPDPWNFVLMPKIRGVDGAAGNGKPVF